ncbi:MAG: hypothetical protein NZ951_00470 [Dehalococcoidia bacterium]|nr:hypothetical protein [Dehalococcoidia bacterium]MDW8119119.1 hypothetical protein [Chloroflexota bacterium]
MPPRRQDPLYAQARQLAKDWAELYQQFQQVQKQAEALNALLNARIEDIQALRRQSEEAESAYRFVRQRLEGLLEALEKVLARPWPPEASFLREEVARAVATARQDLPTLG